MKFELRENILFVRVKGLGLKMSIFKRVSLLKIKLHYI